MSTSCIYLLRNTLQHYTLMQSAPLWIVFQTGTTEYIHSVYSRFWDENGFLYWFSILEHTILYLVAQYIPLFTDARRFDYYYTKYILRILPLSFLCQKRAFSKNIFLLSRHTRRQFGRANVLKSMYFMHLAFTTYFFTPLKKKKNDAKNF